MATKLKQTKNNIGIKNNNGNNNNIMTIIMAWIENDNNNDKKNNNHSIKTMMEAIMTIMTKNL